MPEARVVGPRIVADPARGAAADAGREGAAMTAQTGRIDAAFGCRAIDCARGEALHAADAAPQNAASRAELRDVVPSPTRLHVPALAQPVRRPEGGRRPGRSGLRFGHLVRPMRAPTGGATSAQGRTTNWSLRRFRGLRSCAQEIECSPQRRVALGVGQHSTDSLTFLVAEELSQSPFCPRPLRLESTPRCWPSPSV